MELLCLIIIVVVLVAILDGDDDYDKHEEAESCELECEEEGNSPLVGERTRILVKFSHNKEQFKISWKA